MSKSKQKRVFQIVTNEEFLSEAQLQKGLKNDAIDGYAYILHDKDKHTQDEFDEYKRNNENNNPTWRVGDLKAKHWHIFVRLKSPRYATTIAKIFNIEPSRVLYIDSVRGTLQYLIHLNHKEKYQYSFEEVKSNFDYQDCILSKPTLEANTEARLLEIENLIETGALTDYNLYTSGLITAREFARWGNKYIKPMLQFYRGQMEAKMKMEGRNMEVIYIEGRAGSGKTTYAKYIAEQKGLSYFVSSSSNDPLDGYQGEACVILDDMRGSVFLLSDLLKLLDNNTSSKVKSRYYNKTLFCKLLIITSVKSMDDFYTKFLQEDEPKEQFYRRCKTKIIMTRDTIEIHSYNKDSNKYDYLATFNNPIRDKVNLCAEPLQDRFEKTLNELGLQKDQATQISSKLDDGTINEIVINEDDLPF